MIDELRCIKTVLGVVAYCSPREGGINISSCLTFALNIEIVEEDVGKLRLQSVLPVLCESNIVSELRVKVDARNKLRCQQAYI